MQWLFALFSGTSCLFLQIFISSICRLAKTWANLKITLLLVCFKKLIKVITCKKITISMFQILLNLNKMVGQEMEQWESLCSFRLEHKLLLTFTAEVLVWLILTSSWQKSVTVYPSWAALQAIKSKKWKMGRMVTSHPLEKPNSLFSHPNSLPDFLLLFKKAQLHPVSFQLIVLSWTVSESWQGADHKNCFSFCD